MIFFLPAIFFPIEKYGSGLRNDQGIRDANKVKIGDLFQAKIEDVVFGGDGIARLGSLVVFMPGTIPGEVVAGKIIKVKKDYCRAETIKILEPSPDRIEPRCPCFGRCPGCSYQHMEYRRECELKHSQLLGQLRPLLGVTDAEKVLPPIASGQEYHYRNKIVLHVHRSAGDIDIGYFKSDNTTVVDIAQCPLAHREINDKLAELRSNKSFYHSLHDRMNVTLQYTECNGVVYWRNQPDTKMSWLKDNVDGELFSIPAGSFFQVNPFGAAALRHEVVSYLKRRNYSVLIDAYCGSGYFACAAARAGIPVVRGVEIDAAAVAAANYNLSRCDCADAEILEMDAAEYLPRILASVSGRTALLVDPPRGGLARKAANAIGASNVETVIYISCNPATLCRDLRILAQYGLDIEVIRAIDMFPRTAHFEVFSVLHRK